MFWDTNLGGATTFCGAEIERSACAMGKRGTPFSYMILKNVILFFPILIKLGRKTLNDFFYREGCIDWIFCFTERVDNTFVSILSVR